MKFKAVRASLAAALTAIFLIPALPSASVVYAGEAQSASSSKPRRSRNGDPLAKWEQNQEKAAEQVMSQTSSQEDSKASSTQSSSLQAQFADANLSAILEGSLQQRFAEEQPANDNSPPDSSTAQQSDSSQQQREPPPFDRPPINTRKQPANPPARSQPSDPRKQPNDSNTSGDSGYTRPPSNSGGTQRDRSSDSSGGVSDPGRNDRNSGPPPVLRRPTDSRTSNDPNQDPGPPVLRRPSDPQSRDDGRSQTGTGSKPGQQQSGDEEVIKLESTLVNLPILVSDRAGRYVPQLTAKDFLLFEDGAQQTIANFGTEEVPFSVVLLLDVSPSVAGSVEDIHEAAIAFVRQLRPQDRIMIVSFDRHIHYLSEFTNDHRELEFAIRRANTGSGTSVYDAVYEAVERKLRNVEGRKALILFSDGEDTTSSHASYDDAVHLVTESDVLVYGLRYPGTGVQMGGGGRGIPWPRNPGGGVQLPLPLPLPLPIPWPMPRRRRGPFFLTDPNSPGSAATPQQWPRRRGGGGDFMADITAAGGGPVYDAEKISDMSRVANRIAEELRHVYVISYYPTNPVSNGGYRAVRVSVKGRDDIAVRHRRGYNAKPAGSTRAAN